MKLQANLMMLLAAAIWGFAFVAQRVGMDYIGPFTFNGVRFALGGLSLLPLIYFFSRHSTQSDDGQRASSCWRAGLVAGIILFIAASLQQIGLQYTSAGKSAFITGLYIVLVPIAGIFLKQHVHMEMWIGCLLGIVGLYFLCVKEGFTVAYGDVLELIGAFFWTAHILWIDHFSGKVDTLKLAFSQFMTCAVLSLGTALIIEPVAVSSIVSAGIPLLYGGLCSVGIAYTLQIVGQKYASPSHAAIILSMETVFAAIGGYLILNERLGTLEFAGCVLMMAGVLVSQLSNFKPHQQTSAAISDQK